MSAINPLFRNIANIVTGKMNPKISEVNMRMTLWYTVSSKWMANIMKMIIVKEGGTKRVDTILAVFREMLLKFIQRFHSLLSAQGT